MSAPRCLAGVRPPSTAKLIPSLSFALALASGSCGPEPQAARAQALAIELDERPVLVGEVVERVEARSYVYLRLAITRDGAGPGSRAPAGERWVALDGEAPALGERVRVRSLARRSAVWEPELEREFATLEYVAWIR